MTCPHLLVAAGLTTVLLLWAAPGAASSDYAEVLQDELSMDCAPPCTLCHRSNAGGYGTVGRDAGGTGFGDALMQVGGVSGDDPTRLRAALEALDAAGTDSDGDGQPDVDELRSTRDPNTPGAGDLCLVHYGCGASVAPGGADRPAAPTTVILLTLLGALFVAASRWARRGA